MKSFAKNYFLSLVYQILIVLIPLITAPYLSRVLGADRIGAYSFVQSIVSYFTMFAVMGTAIYGQRRIATAYARKESLKQPFVELVILRFCGVAGALLIYFTLIFPFADEPILYLVAAIEIVAVVFDISWFFQGVESFDKITFCNGISKTIGVLAIFVFVKSREDLALYVVFLCGSVLIGNILQWTALRPWLRGQAVSGVHVLHHLRPALALFVSQFAIQAYTVLDKTMIGLITGSDFENGYYDQAQRLIRALVTVVTSIGVVMASRIAILWNSKGDNKAEIQKMLLFSFRLIFALSLPLAAGTTIIAHQFVPFFYGDGYEPVIVQIRLLTLLLPIIGCSNIIGTQLFVPSGRERLLTRSVMMGAGANVVLNGVFIPAFGATGAVIASVIAELVVTSVQFYLARNEIPIREVLKLLVHYVLYTTIIGAIGCAVSYLAPNNVIGMFITVFACVVVYAVILLLKKDKVLCLFSM